MANSPLMGRRRQETITTTPQPKKKRKPKRSSQLQILGFAIQGNRKIEDNITHCIQAGGRKGMPRGNCATQRSQLN